MTWVRISPSQCDPNIHVHCNSQYHPRCCPPAPPSFHRAVQLLYESYKWTQSRLHKTQSCSKRFWGVSTTLLFVLHEKANYHKRIACPRVCVRLWEWVLSVRRQLGLSLHIKFQMHTQLPNFVNNCDDSRSFNRSFSVQISEGTFLLRAH